MRVTHENGTVLELKPGDAYVVEPGHDADVLGEERFIGFEFEQKSAEEYARQMPQGRATITARGGNPLAGPVPRVRAI